MNVRTRIATIATAAVIAVSAAGGAMADSPQVTQKITGGEFTYSLSDGQMSPITFDYARTADVSTSGSLTLTVNDGRGTKQGWTVSIASGDFIYAGDAPGSNDIAASRFSVNPSDPTSVEGEGLAGVTRAQGGALNAAVPVITAASGKGSGKYTQQLPVTLNVPATAPAGTYTATITVSTTLAPGQQG